MKLICGLGNPGDKYKLTRHNVGWLFLDYIESKSELLKKKEEKGLEMKEVLYKGMKIQLLRPLSFMNLSGEPLSRYMNYYKAESSDLCLVYDDIDLPFAALRFREKGGAGTHNGMKSVLAQLGRDDLARIRIGIESRGESMPKEMDLASFVLARFTEEEEEKMNSIWKDAEQFLDEWLGLV
jgi:PTH1 family peptidyl-tRNA hydrolase